jgi:hypothetical protein
LSQLLAVTHDEIDQMEQSSPQAKECALTMARSAEKGVSTLQLAIAQCQLDDFANVKAMLKNNLPAHCKQWSLVDWTSA